MAINEVTHETTRSDIDAAHPVQSVTFTPGLRQICLRNMAERTSKMAHDLEDFASPALKAEAAAWHALASALWEAAERDAASHGAALGAMVSIQDEFRDT